MRDFITALAIVSLLMLVTGLFYKKIKKSLLSEPIIAVTVGILLGPQVLNILDMHDWGHFEGIMEVAAHRSASLRTARLPLPLRQ